MQVAISTLARLLRVNHKIFGVAGTKDKRGVTVQVRARRPRVLRGSAAGCAVAVLQARERSWMEACESSVAETRQPLLCAAAAGGQAVTVHRVDPARLAALNPRLRSMRVGNFSFCDGGLWLGDLSGNRCTWVELGVGFEFRSGVPKARLFQARPWAAPGVLGSSLSSYPAKLLAACCSLYALHIPLMFTGLRSCCETWRRKAQWWWRRRPRGCANRGS